MPRSMTMNDRNQSVASVALDLRTTHRERGSSRSKAQDCKGRGGDSRVAVTVGPPRHTGAQGHGNGIASPVAGRPISACPAPTNSPHSAALDANAADRRIPDKSSSRLPFRKRPEPPAAQDSGDGLCPAENTDPTRQWSPPKRVKRTASEERFCVAPSPRARIDEAGQGHDGYPVCLNPYRLPQVYPAYCLSPVPLPHHFFPLTQQTEHPLADVTLATRQDEDGDTALHIAVVKEEEAVVQTLLYVLACAHRDLNIYNNLRQTPLHLAVITHQAGMADILLRAGADPGALDRNGQTALHLCCEYGRQDCLSVVLSRSSSAHLEIRNFEGLSPLHLAVQGGHKDLARMLLDAGADINAMDIKSGQSPLMHAVESNNVDLVHFLIESGSNVNGQSYSGNTALHGACGRGQVDTVRLLLKSGADCSLKNYHNDTPVMVAKNNKIADVLRGKGSKQRSQDQQFVLVSPHNSNLTASASSSPNQSL
ncbi:B-cell lymphoma 3 protein homolog isoform 2-T2 [Polymixia lowei]